MAINVFNGISVEMGTNQVYNNSTWHFNQNLLAEYYPKALKVLRDTCEVLNTLNSPSQLPSQLSEALNNLFCSLFECSRSIKKFINDNRKSYYVTKSFSMDYYIHLDISKEVKDIMFSLSTDKIDISIIENDIEKCKHFMGVVKENGI